MPTARTRASAASDWTALCFMFGLSSGRSLAHQEWRGTSGNASTPDAHSGRRRARQPETRGEARRSYHRLMPSDGDWPARRWASRCSRRSGSGRRTADRVPSDPVGAATKTEFAWADAIQRMLAIASRFLSWPGMGTQLVGADDVRSLERAEPIALGEPSV